LTGSAVAQRIAGNFATEVTKFRKVMPKDYKRVLTVMREAAAEGLDEETTVDRVMEAARG
jgi:glutamate synthase (NADPH/NADH) large chain